MPTHSTHRPDTGSSRSAGPSTYQPTATVVEPFHFSHHQDPVARPTTADYVPMAAAVTHFQTATPERYHKPAKDAVFKPSVGRARTMLHRCPLHYF